jgi:PhnB protein
MTQTNQERPNIAEEEIRQLLEDWSDAHRAKDAARLMSHCTPETVQFILAPPLQYSKSNAWDKHALAAWFAGFEGAIGYEIRDLTIVAGSDTAFCHFLHRLSATSITQGAFSMWDRATFGLRKIENRWRVAHVHESVPFYMDGSFRAAVDLEPQA